MGQVISLSTTREITNTMIASPPYQGHQQPGANQMPDQQPRIDFGLGSSHIIWIVTISQNDQSSEEG